MFHLRIVICSFATKYNPIIYNSFVYVYWNSHSLSWKRAKPIDSGYILSIHILHELQLYYRGQALISNDWSNQFMPSKIYDSPIFCDINTCTSNEIERSEWNGRFTCRVLSVANVRRRDVRPLADVSKQLLFHSPMRYKNYLVIAARSIYLHPSMRWCFELSCFKNKFSKLIHRLKLGELLLIYT